MGGGASKMCGSQNVSEPKIAGPGVGAAHAAVAAATPQGTGGHYSGTQNVSEPKIAGPGVGAAHAAVAAATPQGTGGHYSGTLEETLAFEHGLRRMGINRSEVRTVIPPPFFLELNKHLFCVFDACRLFPLSLARYWHFCRASTWDLFWCSGVTLVCPPFSVPRQKTLS
jgi:hypothetical protein